MAEASTQQIGAGASSPGDSSGTLAAMVQLAQLRNEGPIVSPGPLPVPGAVRGEQIGVVQAVNGEAISNSVDQTSNTLKPGDPIYQGDIIATRAGGIEIAFSDGTIGHLGANAQMLVQDFATGIGSAAPVLFVIAGPFSFASPPGGVIAANAITVRTPVASVRLEGGRLVGKAAAEAVENRFTLVKNFDGTLGRAIIATASATYTLNSELASAQVISLFREPSPIQMQSFAEVQSFLGGSVFDWIAAPAAGPDETTVQIASVDGVVRVTDFDGTPTGGFDDFAPQSNPALAGIGGDDGRFTSIGADRPFDPIFPSADPETSPVADPIVFDTGITTISLSGVSAVAGNPGFDKLVVNTDPVNANVITIGQDANGNVVIGNGAGDQLTGDAFEELEVNFGSAGDSVNIGDLSATDIANNTVILNLGDGNDTVTAPNINRRVVANGEDGDDNITTGSQGDDLNGGAGNDTLNGNGGNDLLLGGAGADTMDGGAGTDTASYAGSSAAVNVNLATGTGTGGDAQGDTLTANTIENLLGSSNNDTLTGDANANRLDGGAGADTLAGAAGNDTYVVDNAGDVVTELGGGGTDTVESSINHTLAANVENLTLKGTDNISGTGNSENNTLTGNSGSNALAGGAGDDTYVVQNAGDTVTENAAAGTDTVQSSVSFTLGANVENLTLTGTANINGTGNTESNTLTGNSGNNILTGGDGTDTLIGLGGADTLSGGNGTDTASYAASASGVQVGLSGAAGTGGDAAGDTLTGIENLIGSGHADTLTGDGNVNALTGGAGNDTLDGGSGADTLIGGTGDDTYVVDNTSDTITENASEGTDLVQSSATYTLASNVENLTLTGSSAIDGTGNSAANTIAGNSGNNTIAGLGGADAIDGNGGTDTASYAASGSAVQIALSGAAGTGGDAAGDTLTEVENLIGSGHADTLTGDAGANSINGGAGNDTLAGLGGGDTLTGGGGTDTVTYAASASGVTVDLDGNTASGGDAAGDTLTGIVNLIGSGSGDVLTGDGNANTLTGGGGGDTLSGGGAADILSGGAGNDILHGGSGADTLTGGTGTDTLNGDGDNDILAGLDGADVLNGGAGTDTATYAASSAGVTVNLATGTGSGGDAAGDTLTLNTIENLIGSASADILTGDANANTLNGGAGADTLTGGAGDDIYVVDNTSDTVTENAAEGTDLVQSSVSFTLAANVENLSLTGSTAINGTGNSLDNTIAGNAGNNTLIGLGGADAIDGNGGTDTVSYAASANGVQIALSGAAGTGGDAAGDTLTDVENLIGSAQVDTLTGSSASNRIDGGAGADTMTGLGGNDTYVVDDAGDVVTEAAAGGTDTIESSVTLTLAANVEHLTLTGSSAIDGTGNAENNTLTGNDGINTLSGGAGDDTYIVQTAGDTVFENAAEGTDTVQSSVTFTLASDVEHLTLTGTGAINGTGNSQNNTLTGNDGVNALSGGDGDDTYVIQTVGDTVIENAAEGTDTVQSSVSFTLGANVEHLTLTGSSSINATGNSENNTLTGNNQANVLTGGVGADTLSGNDGADTLVGGSGVDVLTGGSGADTLFGGDGADTLNATAGNDDLYFSTTGEGGDTVNGFTTGSDEFLFLQSAFGNLSAGNLTADSFEIVSGYDGTNGTNAAATGSTAGFIYDSASGALTYDADGNNGAAGFTIATLSSGSVAASDIQIVTTSPV